MSRRRVLVTGVTGQDGSYLAERLLADGDEVIGAVRAPEGAFERAGLASLAGRMPLLRMELLEPDSIRRAVAEAAPDEIYHLAAPTFVPDAASAPEETRAAIVDGTEAVLAAAGDGVRVLLAASSEVFGACEESPQSERTPMRPRNAYGEAKLAVHRMAGRERERGRFVVSAITYNHESPRRPPRFVTRSITQGVAAIAAGRAERLGVGNQEAVRDWSHAEDVIAGMVLALRHGEPDDYVLASGVGHTVGELVDLAFAAAGVERRLPSGEDRVYTDERYWRPVEAHPLVGDPTKARATLGWKPRVAFEQLVAEMVAADLARAGVALPPGAPTARPTAPRPSAEA
jgi:GDPmannose 4,6-dehydratase